MPPKPFNPLLLATDHRGATRRAFGEGQTGKGGSSTF